jgi:hypothetical protein
MGEQLKHAACKETENVAIDGSLVNLVDLQYNNNNKNK